MGFNIKHFILFDKTLKRKTKLQSYILFSPKMEIIFFILLSCLHKSVIDILEKF